MEEGCRLAAIQLGEDRRKRRVPRPRRAGRGRVTRHDGDAIRVERVEGIFDLGNSRARIFCNKADPELLAIDRFYRTAEDIDASLHGRAIQAWLEGDILRIAAVD